ncbi:DNA/RNA nuclease SfsA [Thermococci archaeon]|nr:MAG: DNA/RNA nuclease SfsA [Thermococci archaeon]
MKSILKLEILECTFLKRLNRFVGLVDINGDIKKALITNTGRLEEFMIEGRRAFCIPKSGGKTEFVLLGFLEKNGRIAIIDTRTQTKAFEKAIELGLISWLEGCSIKKKEVKIGNSRLDYIFKCPDTEIYAEMKSAVLREDNYAMYPDCPSARGRKHIKELIKLKEEGNKSMIFFIGALPGVEKFKPYEEGDAEIARLLREAREKGVEIRALSISMLQNGEIVLENDDLEVEV